MPRSAIYAVVVLLKAINRGGTQKFHTIPFNLLTIFDKTELNSKIRLNFSEQKQLMIQFK